MLAEAGAMYGKNNTASSLKPYERCSMVDVSVCVVFIVMVIRLFCKCSDFHCETAHDRVVNIVLYS